MNDSGIDKNALNLRPLPGSERRPAPGLREGPVPLDPDAHVEATLVLRRRGEVPDDALESRMPASEFNAKYGADPADIDLVTSTVTRLGADVIESDAATRRVRISGTASNLGRIFGTTLAQATSPDAHGRPVAHRHRTGGLSVPADLDGIVTAVLGLDDRPQAKARFQVAASAAISRSYTPLELGAIYNFPANTNGAGQTIAIIELGGGFAQSDLDAYFGGLGITGPRVTAVGIDGGANVPGQDPNGADGEVLLDIEVAGALAPAADIVVYFAPNTDAGFLDALSQAAHATPTPAAISISWGQSEDAWTAQARTAFDQALVDAAALGVTVTAAAGDDGSSDRAADGRVHADFPASSPHALACGGTRLDADAATGVVASEIVWNNGAGNGATGGGVSTVFGLPAWQASVGVPTPSGRAGRGVPDVSAVADPTTGYRVRVDGKELVIGGTSAVAPLWAALLARLAQAKGSTLGLVQPKLYNGTLRSRTPAGFRDITVGNNGAYSAGPGWDPCTGLGVPDGADLLSAI
ncbi:MAG: kumamolisin [Microbacteriaceae bacterium]|nr:kumamolisin [Microbacteriaceae bacterium]